MLGKGNVVRVPITHDGQDAVLRLVVDEVMTGKDGPECHLSGSQGGVWIPAALLWSAIAQAEISIDPGLPVTARELGLPY
jgi:hypothetical protein